MGGASSPGNGSVGSVAGSGEAAEQWNSSLMSSRAASAMIEMLIALASRTSGGHAPRNFMISGRNTSSTGVDATVCAKATRRGFASLSRAEFGRIGHVWPLVYVESITGDPHYALVARLLQETGVDGDMTGKRLREAYVSVKERNPAVLRWLRHATVRLETLETEGKMVLFATGCDGEDSTQPASK